MPNVENALSSVIYQDVLATLALLFGIGLIRFITVRALRRSRLAADDRRRLLVNTRTLFIGLLFFGLAFIWAHQVRAVALSIVAIAAAIAIATKEVLLCLSGAFVRIVSRAFSVGDRIEVAGHRGDVVDIGAFTTRIMEVGAGYSRRSGRDVVLPNALFVNNPVVNERRADRYALHVLKVPVRLDSGWTEAEQALLSAATTECADILEEARRQLTQHQVQQELEPLTVDPVVSLQMPAPDRVDLVLRYPAAAGERARVEQGILRRYLQTVGEKIRVPTA
jgi:small-conductance mechanosensitive channel